MTDCLFCKIAVGEIPAVVVYQDDEMMAFEDIAPQAPVHVLVIPKVHVASLAQMQDEALMGRLMLRAAQIAQEKGMVLPGYRVVTNIGRDGGQSVGHLHLHVLAGRALQWPPG